MTQKEEWLTKIESARQQFLQLLDSIPEAEYANPSDNSAWTIGDVLYHITLGPTAMAFELWMLTHVQGLFDFGMKIFPSALFNHVNAWFARKDTRHLRRAELAKAYERGHARLKSVLEKVSERDLAKSVAYPAAFVAELAGEVTVVRLIHYAKDHVDIHAMQIRQAREKVSA